MSNKMVVALQLALLTGQLVFPKQIAAAKLEPEAAQGFDQYVHLTEDRLRKELSPGGIFLWVDGFPDSLRIAAHERLRRGDVIAERFKAVDNSGMIPVPGAMIHHWIGTIFIPNASLRQVLAVLQDYDRHFIYYRPEVTKSKILGHTGDDFKVYFRLTRKKIITVVLDTEYDVQYQRLDDIHAQSRSYSTRIAEIERPGEPNERAMTPGNDDGFLWRLYSYWRFSEEDHGVYVQCEAISLTRDVPIGLNWLIGPFIESIPRESLEFMLRSTRTAVLDKMSHPSQ